MIFPFILVCLFVCAFSWRSCKNIMNLDCYLRLSAEQYAKAPTCWVSANFKFGIDYVPVPLQLWALDSAPKSLLTFSGIYDVSMDFYHYLSSCHKAKNFYSMFLLMQSMNMWISVFLSILPFLLLACLINGGALPREDLLAQMNTKGSLYSLGDLWIELFEMQ